MTDDDAARLDWARLVKRLTAFAMRRGAADLRDAEDLAQEAVTRYLTSLERRSAPNALLDLGSIVNGLLQNRRRTKSLTMAVPTDPGAPGGPIATLATDDTDPAASGDDRTWGRKALDLLLVAIEQDEVAQEIVMAEWDGVEQPDHPAHLGRTVTELKFARRRLRRAYDKVREQLIREGYDAEED